MWSKIVLEFSKSPENFNQVLVACCATALKSKKVELLKQVVYLENSGLSVTESNSDVTAFSNDQPK